MSIQPFINIIRSKEQLNTSLLSILLPDLAEPKNTKDQIRRQVALEAIDDWHKRVLTIFRDAIEERKTEHKKMREDFDALNLELAQAKARETEHASQLRAAREGRGVYENAELTAKKKEVARLQLANDELRRQLAIAQEEAKRANDTLDGKDVAIRAYARDIEQLTTAAALNAQRREKQAEIVRAAYAEAVAMIQERWPGSPFAAMVLEQLAKIPANLVS